MRKSEQIKFLQKLVKSKRFKAMVEDLRKAHKKEMDYFHKHEQTGLEK